jgi:CheY-like chemotaxis protein
MIPTDRKSNISRRHVRDGEAALLLLAQKRYGLVISDWEMRPMGGHELIRKIRADPLLCDVEVATLLSLLFGTPRRHCHSSVSAV